VARTSKHILQIAFYPSLLTTRAKMLEVDGYRVTSVLGEAGARAFPADELAAVDLILVGFSAPRDVRASVVNWVKQQKLSTPLIVLQAQSWEQFDGADMTALSEDPQVWLAAVAKMLTAN